MTERDVQSTLVGKIADSADFTDTEKVALMIALLSIDWSKAFTVSVQACAPEAAAKLVSKWAKQQGAQL